MTPAPLFRQQVFMQWLFLVAQVYTEMVQIPTNMAQDGRTTMRVGRTVKIRHLHLRGGHC